MITVVPTIDVEGMHGNKPFDQFVLGKVGTEQMWGVYRIAEIFQRYGFSATFFVDCYEHTFWGETCIEEVCQNLANMNQDVQLHTHPAWRDDVYDYQWLRDLKKKKSYFPQSLDFMSKLSFSQQVECLEHGITLLKKWLGKAPVAHRSGGYSINQETIEALVKTGIELDSSMNAAHQNSQVVWSQNKVVCKEGLIELPVTIFDYKFELSLLGRKKTFFSKAMKTDLDTCTVSEFEAYIDQAEILGLKVMNLFMHSYSLLDFDLFYTDIKPEPDDVTKLDQLLSVLSHRNDVQVINCTEFLKQFHRAPSDFQGPDGMPSVRTNKKIAQLAFRKGINRVRSYWPPRQLYNKVDGIG